MKQAIRRLYQQARRERCKVTTYIDDQGRSWATWPDDCKAEWSYGYTGRFYAGGFWF